MRTKVMLIRCSAGLCVLTGLVSCSTPGATGEPKPVSTMPLSETDPKAAEAAPANGEVAPEAQVSSAMTLADARQLQTQVMDFADEMMLRMAEAIDDIEGTAKTMEGRIVAHRLKYTVAHGAMIIASAQNPRIALVDMYVMISLQRALIDAKIVPQYFGAEAVRLVSTFASSEKEIRGLAEKALTPEQLAEIDRLIAQWLENNPDRIYASYVRFSEFSAARQVTAGQVAKGRASNVLGFLFIDPLAGLDPTTREIEQARLFAERAFYSLQRMPMLLSWQAELLMIDTASEPETRQVLANMQSLTGSVEQITAELDQLHSEIPGIISGEREAILAEVSVLVDQQRQLAIDQALAGISAERQATVEQLAADEARLGPMLGELRTTVEAGTALSQSLRETTTTFSQLATQLGLDQSQKSDRPDQPASGGDGESFDIASYTDALREATGTAQELTRLTESLMGATDPAVLESRLGLVDGRIDRVEGTMDRLLGRVLWIGLMLIGAATVGGIIVVLVWSRVRPSGQITVSSARVGSAGDQHDRQ